MVRSELALKKLKLRGIARRALKSHTPLRWLIRAKASQVFRQCRTLGIRNRSGTAPSPRRTCSPVPCIRIVDHIFYCSLAAAALVGAHARRCCWHVNAASSGRIPINRTIDSSSLRRSGTLRSAPLRSARGVCFARLVACKELISIARTSRPVVLSSPGESDGRSERCVLDVALREAAFDSDRRSRRRREVRRVVATEAEKSHDVAPARGRRAADWTARP